MPSNPPITIKQWIIDFNKSIDQLETQLKLMIDSVILAQRNPFNFPKTKKRPEQILPSLISALITAVSTATKIQSVLIDNKIPIDKVKNLMVDANIVLNSTTVVKAYLNPIIAKSVLQNPSALGLILSSDLSLIKNWVNKNITPLISQ